MKIQDIEKILFCLLDDLVKEGQTIDEPIILKGKEGVAIHDILHIIAGNSYDYVKNYSPFVFWDNRPVVCYEEIWKEEIKNKLTCWRMQG